MSTTAPRLPDSPDFVEAMGLLASIPDEAMQRPWPFRGQAELMGVGDGIHMALKHELIAAGRSLAVPRTEIQVALGRAQEAYGQLRGLLVNLDHLADTEPGNAAWTLRLTVGHCLDAEVSYRVQAAYSAGRRDDQPVPLPPELRRPDDDLSGSLTDILDRLGAERTLADAELWEWPDSVLARPTLWAGLDWELRFRIHRFAAHLVEHTIQCEQVLAAIGQPVSEARTIVRHIWGLRGSHLRFTPADELKRLDRAQLERASDIAAVAGVAV